MEKAIVMMGRENIGGEVSENYQMSLNRIVTCFKYDPSWGDHNKFVDSVIAVFANKMYLEMLGGLEYEIGISNGWKKDDNGKNARIEEIDDQTITDFTKKLKAKMYELNQSYDNRLSLTPWEERN